MLKELSETRAEVEKLLPTLGIDKGDEQEVDNILKIMNGGLWEGLDFPHQHRHNMRVARDAARIARMTRMKPGEKDLLDRGAMLHDVGRLLVERGKIAEEEHHKGSYLLAKVISTVWWRFPEKRADRFAKGIAMHIEDVLDRNVDRWVRVLRDADRTSRLGIEGLIEQAWYLGFRGDAINEIPVEPTIYDDLWTQMPTAFAINKFHERSRMYMEENVKPWLIEHGKLPDLARGAEVLINRIYGVRNEGREGGRWKIEPVSRKALKIAEPRVIRMFEFFSDMEIKIEANGSVLIGPGVRGDVFEQVEEADVGDEFVLGTGR